jgi:hypothetical protein
VRQFAEDQSIERDVFQQAAIIASF